MIKYVVNYRPLVSLSHLCRTSVSLDFGDPAWGMPHARARGARGDPHADRAGSPFPPGFARSASPVGPCCMSSAEVQVFACSLSFVLAASDGQVDRVILSHYRLYSSLHSLERTTTYPGVPDGHRSLFKVRVHSLFPATSSARRHRPARVRRLRTARRPPRTSHPAD